MFVSTEWLAGHLFDPGLVVVDMRWREDGSGRALYERGHIPGAVFLNWSSDIADRDHRAAFMLPPPDRFAAAVEERGITDETEVVAYSDRMGSGPHRLWWAFRVYGHEDVRILDGGLERWMAKGLPTTAEVSSPRPGSWTPRPEPVGGRRLVATASDVETAGATPGESSPRVLDSRPPEQFRGEWVWFETGPVRVDPDGIARTDRGEVRGGRVPWATNVPASVLYRADGTMKGRDELLQLFAQVGVGPGDRAITYCGVGISAAALLFALDRAGIKDAALYDASWDEWGRDPRFPVARG